MFAISDKIYICKPDEENGLQNLTLSQLNEDNKDRGKHRIITLKRE